MKSVKILNYASYTFTALIIIASLLFAYLQLIPVDVLRNWSITTDSNHYHSGGKLIATIEYEKVREASSKTFYYIECERPNGSFVRYPMSQTQSNRPKGKGTSQLPMTIPADIANLPATCRLTISVTYNVFRFRNVVEEAHSNKFLVVQKD